MIKVDIKQEVAELEKNDEKYETKVTPFYDGDNLTHKHIFIPLLKQTYVRTNDHQWYSLADLNCDYCT